MHILNALTCARRHINSQREVGNYLENNVEAKTSH